MPLVGPRKHYEIQEIVSRVSFRDWHFHVAKGDCVYIQLQFVDPTTGAAQMCRKWMLSGHMTELEIVNTCLLAVRTAMEHEILEQFTYDGIAIYNPHMSLAARNEGVEGYPLDRRAQHV